MKSTLTLGDGFVSVCPFPETLLAKLHYWKRQLVVNERTHRREFKGSNELLYTLQTGVGEDGKAVQTCFTLPGFAKRIKDHLIQGGGTVTVVDARTPMPAPDMAKAMTGLREYQYELVYNLLMSGGGILSGATGLGKTHVIKALCNAYPHEPLKLRGTPTIVVAVPDRDITQKNFDDLTKLLPDRDVGIIMSGKKNKVSDDIQVITLDSLHKLDADDVGIVIVDEMHTAASDSRAQELLRFTKARFWGVSATPDGRFDGKDTVAEGIFGPIVARFTYQDGVKAGCLVPIKVFWVDCPEPNIGLENYYRYKMKDQRYKWGVHNNRPLNDLIGRIYAGLPKELQALGMLQFTRHMEQVLRGCAKAGGDLPVQCHAGKAAEEFPTSSFWHVHAISDKERDVIYGRMKSGEIRKAISTHVWKQGVDFPDLRIVINLGGGGSEIVAKQVPGRASRKADGKDYAYIIEFRHHWDTVKSPKTGREIAGPVFRDDVARMRIYNELGFEQVDLLNERELPWMGNSSSPTR